MNAPTNLPDALLRIGQLERQRDALARALEAMVELYGSEYAASMLAHSRAVLKQARDT